MEQNRTYVAIDLKSFYASVECMERGLDPMTTNLVVADARRTTKTICLAVSPSLKAYGISGRARLFEVVQKVKLINSRRQANAPGRKLQGESCFSKELEQNPSFALSYITASPRMALYLDYSTRIYQIYLNYVAPEDIHVYSIDEVFIDVTGYLETYHMTAKELARKMIQNVLDATGITATAGIGTNLYLAKIAMDIGAKHIAPDKDGVRIAELDQESYRRNLWSHRPLTDFWRVGKGYARKLEKHGLYTMGDIARCSLGKPEDFHNQYLLYRLFGVHAELLIDHAWGWEPVTIEHIKNYRPATKSIASGQVLQEPYDASSARIVVQEMSDMVSLDLVDKGLMTDQIVLTVGYDINNLTDPDISAYYKGEIVKDSYGRRIPKPAHGTVNLKNQTASSRKIVDAVLSLFDRIVDEKLLVRRINLSVNHLMEEKLVKKEEYTEQLDLFSANGEIGKGKTQEDFEREETALAEEKQLQHTMLDIKKKFGKNAVLKGVSLEEGATARERNRQIGGHKA